MKEITEVRILKILQSCLLSQAQLEAVFHRLPDIISLYEKDK